MTKLMRGVNDLATIHTKLAKEWHPTKNEGLTPADVTAGSKKKVWWLLPHDDPKTGKHFDFEWEATIRDRVRYNLGCPYLSGRAVWPGYNDLPTTHPELVKEWHPANQLKPTEVTAGSNKKVLWLIKDADNKEYVWEATVKKRALKKTTCPHLVERQPYSTGNVKDYPKLVAEWHPTKNGALTPSNVTIGSAKKIWWLLPYDDPKTGKHFNFEWKATVFSRAQGSGCPYLTGQAVWPGYNDLETIDSELAKQWHPTKNGALKPTDVTASSRKKVWWLLPHDDPKTGKHFDFEWKATIDDRRHGKGCPYLSGQAVWKGYNDLETTHPELAKEWHPTENGALKPTDVTYASQKKVVWLLQYNDSKTGKHYDFKWEARIDSRAKGAGCPYISSNKGQKTIQDICDDNHILCVPEKTFDDLIYKAKLRFDFYLNNSTTVEYDGMQHFEPCDYFGGKPTFDDTRKRDNIKNQYCRDNNIPLLRIPYIYDPVADKSKIETIILEFVKTHIIPKEILDFYKRQHNNNYYKLFEKM